jgi:hypothetical protein
MRDAFFIMSEIHRAIRQAEPPTLLVEKLVAELRLGIR